MKTKVNEQEMTEMVRNFIGGTTVLETPKLEPQLADTQEQAGPGIIGGIQGDLPSRSVHRRPQARVPQPQHARCPRPHRPHVR